jgi:hypothetical protein
MPREAKEGCKAVETEKLKKLGGNADPCENKGVVKIAVQKLLKTKGLKIDDLRDAVRVDQWRRVEEGTQSSRTLAGRLPHPLLFVK